MRNIICDLQRQTFYFIPDGLYSIVTEHKNKPIDDIKRLYDESQHRIIDEYFSFLLNNELAFLCEQDEMALFPDMDPAWDHYSLINNAIIDFDAGSEHDMGKIIDELDRLGCENIQFRFFDAFEPGYYENIIQFLEGKRVLFAELIIKWSPAITDEWIDRLINTNARLKSMIIHSSPQNILNDTARYSRCKVVQIQQVVDSSLHCGVIMPHYFSVNLKTFTEAHGHNTCLNRKIAVDASGCIKNCPSSHKSFGHIKAISLTEALHAAGFQEAWHISKDEIAVCKDCEFRYICTDCRAYVQDPQDMYSKPLKCGYDPYTATWQSWSENPINQKGIAWYGLQTFK